MFMTHELTPLAARLLQAVQSANGDWINRSSIAADLGRSGNRLNPYDVTLLEQLVTDGVIEATDRLTGTVKTERVYRVKS